jgi:hypothetical protein
MLHRLVLCVSLAFALACGGLPSAQVAVAPPVPPVPAAVGTVAAPAATTKPASTTKGAAKPTKKASSGGGNGEIQVTTAAAVQLYVDGIPATFDPAQGYVMSVAPGTHHIEIVNLAGRTQVDEDVQIDASTRSMWRYKNGGVFESKGHAPVHHSEPAPAPEPVPEAVYVPVGNVLFDGANVYDARVWVDGYEAGRGEAGDYWSTGLGEGPHELRIEAQGKVIYSGPVDVRGNQTRRCTTSIDSYSGEAYGFDCHWIAA